jgi:hypothetical protein
VCFQGKGEGRDLLRDCWPVLLNSYLHDAAIISDYQHTHATPGKYYYFVL